LMRAWLGTFAYRIDPGVGVFLISAVCVVIISLATVSYQSIRAALANPAESLKTE